MTECCCSELERRVQCFLGTFVKELILQLFCPCLSFKVLFCCVIAEFAPNVTDMSHPGYFTHDALVDVFCFTGPCSVV